MFPVGSLAPGLPFQFLLTPVLQIQAVLDLSKAALGLSYFNYNVINI